MAQADCMLACEELMKLDGLGVGGGQIDLDVAAGDRHLGADDDVSRPKPSSSSVASP